MLRNMVKETAAGGLGTGTTVTLSGAQPGYTSFTGFGNGAAVYYMLTDGTQSEMQAGTVTVGSPNTLSRGTPIWNTAGTTSRLNFTGSTTVYNVTPAERSLYADASSVWQAQSRRIAALADGTALTDAPTLQQLNMRRISTTNFATTTGAVQFSLPTTTFRRFRLDYYAVGTAAAPMYVQVSLDGGSTWKAGASDYNTIATSLRSSATASTGGLAAYVQITDAAYASAVNYHGIVEFDIGAGQGISDGYTVTTGPNIARWLGAWSPGFAGTANAVRIGVVGASMSTGNIALSGIY